jgi:hypothetical protein
MGKASLDFQAGIAIINGAQFPSRDAVTRQDRQCFRGLWGREDDDHSNTAVKGPHHFLIGNVATLLKPLKNRW